MGSMMRRVRAAARMGAVWAGIWFTAGILILLLVGSAPPMSPSPSASPSSAFSPG